MEPTSFSPAEDAAARHRSSVHILVSDKDSKARQDILVLLRRCSYQVTPVERAAEVLDVLRSGGPPVDLILAEVELPNGKGYKMLKHIMKEERLKHLPVVMMSALDEMAVVVKCLRLGAADYLVKPLRTNELLNLWTHMWRRRRAVGVTHRMSLNINDPPTDSLGPLDPSESNTGSTDLFSDDTDDKVEKAQAALSSHEVAKRRPAEDRREEPVPILELSLKLSADATQLHSASNVMHRQQRTSKPTGYGTASMKITQLRMGQSSSAFAPLVEQQPESGYGGARMAQKEADSHLSAIFRDSAPRTNTSEPMRHGSHDGSLRSELINPGHLSLATPPLEEQRLHGGAYGGGRVWDSSLGGVNSIGGRLLSPASMESARQFQSPVKLFHREAAYRGEGSRDRLLREAYARDSIAAEPRRSREGVGGQDGGEREMVGNGDERDPMMGRDASGGECFESPIWSGRGTLSEPSQLSSVISGNGYSHMKGRAPCDSRLEMGEMLPPQMPNHMSHMSPHSMNRRSQTGGVPTQIHSTPLAHGPMPPMFHPGEAGPVGGQPQPRFPPYPHSRRGRPRAGGYSLGAVPPWPAMQVPMNDRKMELAERREAALNKFRQKRKDRCFEKKIRYVSRKRLAEQRPRNRGQFVKRNGNGGKEGEEEEEEDEEEEEEREDSTPEEGSGQD